MKKKSHKSRRVRVTIKKTNQGWRLAGVMILLIALISFLAFGSPREDFFGLGQESANTAGGPFLSPLGAGALDIQAVVWIIVIATIIVVLVILFLYSAKRYR